MATYSFKDVNATIAGAGGSFNLADGAAAAEEGITIESTVDKNLMQIGADGRGQNSLIADDSVTITVRLLKTSPVNAQLMLMYNLQSSSSALWGTNVMTVVDSARGDYTSIQSVAFKKLPTLTYAKEAGMNEWTFDGIKRDTILGAG